MGGMCLGSLLLPRLVPRRRHPLRRLRGLGTGDRRVRPGDPVRAAVRWSRSTPRCGHGTWGILFRGLSAAICLLPPTLLMGATLPAIARWVETTPRGVSWLGFFYGGNIAGAVCGCLLAGFYLLRVFDMVTATYVAVAIDVDAWPCWPSPCRWFSRHEAPAAATGRSPATRAGRRGPCYRGDRPVRDVGPGRGGGLDAAAVADARRRPSTRSRSSWPCSCSDWGSAAALGSFLARRDRAAAAGAGRVPVAAGRRPSPGPRS